MSDCQGFAEAVLDEKAPRPEGFAAHLATCEGCRALREGMALGVPSVATRRGLLPDVVADGETGILVDETPEALARALAALARDPSSRGRLGAAAMSRAEREFSLPQAAERLERIYEKLSR